MTAGTDRSRPICSFIIIIINIIIIIIIIIRVTGGIAVGPCKLGQCVSDSGAHARDNSTGSSFPATWRAARTYRPLVMVQGKRRGDSGPDVVDKAVVGLVMAGTVGTRTVRACLSQADASDAWARHSHSAPVVGGIVSCSVVEPLLDGSPFSATWRAACDQRLLPTPQGEGKVREAVGILAAAALSFVRAGTFGTRRCLLSVLGAPREGIGDWPSQVRRVDLAGCISDHGLTNGAAVADTDELGRNEQRLSLMKHYEDWRANIALRGDIAVNARIKPYGATSTGCGQWISDLIHHQAAIVIVDCSADDECSSSEQRSRHRARTYGRTSPSIPSFPPPSPLPVVTSTPRTGPTRTNAVTTIIWVWELAADVRRGRPKDTGLRGGVKERCVPGNWAKRAMRR